MRSRYSAYVRGLAPYIVATSGEARSSDEETFLAEVRQFCAHTRFTGLQIVKVEPGDSVAYVTFRAGLEQGGLDASFTERSRFERTDRWRYVSGERLEETAVG